MDDIITNGDKYGPAMKVKTKEEAAAYLEECIQHNMRVTENSREKAFSIEMQNIGYWAGYYDKGTYERVMDLYDTSHPVFGNDPGIYDSLESAFDKGVEAGEDYMRKNKKQQE